MPNMDVVFLNNDPYRMIQLCVYKGQPEVVNNVIHGIDHFFKTNLLIIQQNDHSEKNLGFSLWIHNDMQTFNPIC